jgi:DNA-binding NarL/FixJ family response regulator
MSGSPKEKFVVTKSEVSSDRVRVLIADADAMGGQLIASALKRCRDQFVVVGLASSEREVLDHAHENKPDVVVLGSALDEGPGSGLTVLEKMRASQPDVKCVVLLHSFDRDLVVESFRSGARGIFSRRGPFKSLAKCIRCVHDGQIWANNEQIEYILEAFAPARPRSTKRNGISLLTPREQAVTALVAEGMKNREIAHALQVTDHTISNYLYHIFDKLGVSSRVELILYALSQDVDMPVQRHPSSIAQQRSNAEA